MGASFSMKPGMRTEGSGIPIPPTIGHGSFAVRDDVNGILFYGSIPIDWMAPMLKVAQDRLHTKKAIIHTGIGWTCHAMMAVTTAAKAPLWMKAMGIGPDNPDWLLSCDCGTSSLTIYSVLARADVLRGSTPSPPHDADDFGRCHRLLKRFPEWRQRLIEVASVYPSWLKPVARWDELAALFEAKKHEELFAILGGSA
jgi:hypothetical protein